MNEIDALLSVNYSQWILTAFVIIFGVVAIADIIGKFSVLIGKPVKWIQSNNKDHKQIENLVLNQKNTEQQITELNKKVDKITETVLDSQIEKMRWDILDFASAVASNRSYSREQFSYVFKIYDKYEKILTDNGMTNGEVEESMEVIREKYREFIGR